MATKKTDSQKLDQIISMIGDVVDVFGKRFDKIEETMATKEQIFKLQTQINAIERELKDIKLSLTRVVYREDMDEALRRIAVIEKHLGLNKKTLA